jgi:hypothetical protein
MYRYLIDGVSSYLKPQTPQKDGMATTRGIIVKMAPTPGKCNLLGTIVGCMTKWGMLIC